MERKPEIMPVDTLTQLIMPGEGGSFASPAASAEPPPLQTASSTNTEVSGGVDVALYSALSNLAEDYLGLVGDVIVSDVLKKGLSVQESINEIAQSIPNQEHAEAFRSRAESLVPIF